MSSHDDLIGASSGALDRIQGPLDLARAWAGTDRLALIVSGSHAAGEAVWVTHAGRMVSLSDLDLYAVVPDEAARRAALARARAARSGLGDRLLAMGLAAPLEVGFHTPRGLAALPARPGTLALRRSARVVDGDAAWLASVPAWSARDVSAEEVWLLLENRAFELLWAAHAPEAGHGLAPLADLERRHAVLKCALELAAVTALSAGEYPERAAERVAWARRHWDAASAPEPPWDEALAWREGRVSALAPEAASAERRRTVAAWVAVWRRLAAVAGNPAHPFAGVLEAARRAPLKRRLRRALAPDPREACLETPPARLRHAAAGTPWHRLNAAAAAQLIYEAARDGADGGRGECHALERGYRAVLSRLGFALEPAAAGDALVKAWDRCILDGQRTERWS